MIISPSHRRKLKTNHCLLLSIIQHPDRIPPYNWNRSGQSPSLISLCQKRGGRKMPHKEMCHLEELPVSLWTRESAGAQVPPSLSRWWSWGKWARRGLGFALLHDVDCEWRFLVQVSMLNTYGVPRCSRFIECFPLSCFTSIVPYNPPNRHLG